MSLQPNDSNAPFEISFACSNCQTTLRIPREMGGVTGPCPNCGATVTAPAAAAEVARRPEVVIKPFTPRPESERTVVVAPPIAPSAVPAFPRPVLTGANLPGPISPLAAPQASAKNAIASNLGPPNPDVPSAPLSLPPTPFAPPSGANAGSSNFGPPNREAPSAPPSLPPTPFAPISGSDAGSSNFGPPNQTSTEAAAADANSATDDPPLPAFLAYQPPAVRLVIPDRNSGASQKLWIRLALRLSGLAAGLMLTWLALWQLGKAPEVSLAGAKEIIAKIFPPAPMAAQAAVKVTSDAWNIAFEAPDSWLPLHPGGNNQIGQLVNLQDPDCRVVMTTTVHGTLTTDAAGANSQLKENLAGQLFRMSLAHGASETGQVSEAKDIGGRKFQFFRKEEEQSSDYFRPRPVTILEYELLENGTAYNFRFTGQGSKAYERLPAMSEQILRSVKPLIKDLRFSTLNNFTLSDPRSIAPETGIDLPSPGPAWSIIPDAPTLFSSFTTMHQNRSYVASQDALKRRPIASGQLGSPSVGYQTAEGDLCGLSVFHLPKDLTVDPAHLASLVLGAWFPDTAVDRQQERPFKAHELDGVEYAGQISRELNPALFVFRLVRRGEMVYALGACSFSEKHSQAQLTAMLDRVQWSAPAYDLSKLTTQHTPGACTEVWEHVLSNLGREHEQANRLAAAMDLYDRAYQTRASFSMLLSLCEVMSKLSQADKATALLEKEWRALPREANSLLQAAKFMARHNKVEIATTLVTTALQSSCNDEHALTFESIESYLDILREAHAKDEALRVLDVLSQRAPDNAWRLWESYILYNTPETKRRAVEIMEGLIAGVRKNRELARDILLFLKVHKAHQIGLDAAMGVLKLDPQAGMAWLLRATCERSLGDEKKATETLAKARQYNPNLRDLDDLAYAITDDAGGPVLREDGPQAPPIPLPPDIQKLLRTEPYANTPKTDDPYQFLYRIRSVTYDPGSAFTSTNRYSIRIQNSTGMEEFNILKLPFHPRGERIQVNELHVRTPDGKTVAPANMKEAFVTEDNADGMLTGMKLLNVPVPGLTPGCVLEYTVTEQSLGVMDGPLTSSFHFATEMPCALDILYIHSPVAKVEYRHSKNSKPLKVPTGYIWVERSLPGISDEMHQPSLEKFVPVLWTGDGSESWARLGLEYLSLIQHKIRPDEGITKLAKDKTKNCKTDAEKISILSQYVRDSLSYAAIEFGMRGLIPNTALESVKNRYGDCKDHSVLLYQMLKAVGIPAKLVLANASTAVQPDLPSLGAFNHMITAVPSVTKGEFDFIDCTNKFMAPEAGVPPLLLADKYVLVLGEASSEFSIDASKLVKIKSIPAGSESITVERTAQVLDARHLDIKESIQLTGLTACEMRYLLAKNTERRDATTAIQRLLGMNRERGQVSLAKVENQLDLTQPLTIHLEYRVLNACSQIGQTLSVRIPNHTALRFLDSDTFGESRRSPFEFATPVNLKLHTKLFGLVGLALVPVELPEQEKRFVRWDARQIYSEGRSELMLSLTRKTGTFAAADYADFQTQIAEATQAIEEVNLVSANQAKELTTKAEAGK